MDQTNITTVTGTSVASIMSADVTPNPACFSPRGIFSECPHCGSRLQPEHAHYRCGSCGWRDSCCD